MKIVKQSASLEHPLDAWNVMTRIESAGRTCYQSEAKGNPADFVRMLLKSGHESVLEHVSASVRVVTDRGVSHEIVRHRIASYSQESTRYCQYGNEIAVIRPPFPAHGNSEFGTTPLEQLWMKAMMTAEAVYLGMLEEGTTPQIARSVLPTCLKTELVMTMNLREWRHFFRLRLSPAAHPQMRELAALVLDLLKTRIPVVFEEFGAVPVSVMPPQ